MFCHRYKSYPLPNPLSQFTLRSNSKSSRSFPRVQVFFSVSTSLKSRSLSAISTLYLPFVIEAFPFTLLFSTELNKPGAFRYPICFQQRQWSPSPPRINPPPPSRSRRQVTRTASSSYSNPRIQDLLTPQARGNSAAHLSPSHASTKPCLSKPSGIETCRPNKRRRITTGKS